MMILNSTATKSTAALYFDASKSVKETNVASTEKSGANSVNTEVKAIVVNNIDKSAAGKAALAPELAAPAASADAIQLNASLKSITENNQVLSAEQVQKAWLNSAESQARLLEQKSAVTIETTAHSASEIASATTTTILTGAAKAVVSDNFSAQPEADAGNFSSREATVSGVAPQAAANGGFNAQIMANSRTQAMLENLDELLKAQQKNKEATAGMKVKSSQLAYQHGQSSASELIKAGEAGRNQAITSGIISFGLSAAGTTTQIRGANKSISAHKTHTSESIKLRHKASEIETEAAVPSRLSSQTASSDTQILKRSAMTKRREADQHDSEARLHTLQGDRQQAYGSAMQGLALGTGQLSGSQFQAVQAEKQSDSQMAATNQQVNNSRAEAEERDAQNAQQLIQQILQEMQQVSQERANTVSSMIRS